MNARQRERLMNALDNAVILTIEEAAMMYHEPNLLVTVRQKVVRAVQAIPKCSSCETWPEPSVARNGGLCNDCKREREAERV